MQSKSEEYSDATKRDYSINKHYFTDKNKMILLP